MVRIVLFLLIGFTLRAQVNVGVQAGLSAKVGSHATSIGLFARSYVNYNFIQLNHSIDIQLSKHSYGNRENMLEMRNAFGLMLSAGQRNTPISFRNDALMNNTDRKYSVGYAYVFYNDNKRTTQNSGGFSLHIGKFSIMHENDVFGGQAKDRFRTGHLKFIWTDSLYQIGLGANFWTGETANTTWQKVCTPDMPTGFRSLEETDYGGTSHGIAYAEIAYNGPFNLQPSFRAGVDSEEIRHAIQNRLFHDLLFLPKKIERSTPHYPRVDEHGCMTLDPKQRRKDRPYLELGLNDYLFH